MLMIHMILIHAKRQLEFFLFWEMECSEVLRTEHSEHNSMGLKKVSQPLPILRHVRIATIYLAYFRYYRNYVIFHKRC